MTLPKYIFFVLFLLIFNYQAVSAEYVRVTVADITSSDSEKIMKAVKETERIVEKIIGRNIDIMIEIDFPQRIIFTTRPPSLDVLMKNTDIVRSNKEFIKLQKFISDNKLWGNQRQSTYRLKTDKAVMK